MAAATVTHFPTLTSLASHKLSFTPPSPILHINRHHQHKFCSRITASSLEKPRVRKNVKSNAELCNDIREFLATVGLPEDHVPSMKELSQHGRQDLANIVRRRGYKFIRQLLKTSTSETLTGSNIDTGQTVELELLSSSEGQNEKLEVLADDASTDEATQEANINSYIETDDKLKMNDQISLPPESTTLSLQEKVAKFIQHGELDTVEDSDLEIANERFVDETERNIELEGSRGSEFARNQQQQNDLPLYSSSSVEILNGNSPPSTQKVEHSVLENINSSSTEEKSSDKDLDNENIQKMENQAEIRRLKFLLHKKELELTQLKQQIEKEKLALSVLQTKAETQISIAQKLISEKENELQVAEESLSGLKEVEVEYSGDGEIVELAGSFNGWHHKIRMEPQRLLSMTGSTGSRTSQTWKAMLWLYPGVYEIKFVVDGHWRIDPQKESFTRGTLHNNILKVDR